ncbi:hypothetical protein MPSEU_000354000 [Mayamaea pseudoterrestris]|nr:hypothetical protein MPSEU_000354000 [Mayamaea pseudoterrestris]
MSRYHTNDDDSDDEGEISTPPPVLSSYAMLANQPPPQAVTQRLNAQRLQQQKNNTESERDNYSDRRNESDRYNSSSGRSGGGDAKWSKSRQDDYHHAASHRSSSWDAPSKNQGRSNNYNTRGGRGGRFSDGRGGRGRGRGGRDSQFRGGGNHDNNYQQQRDNSTTTSRTYSNMLDDDQRSKRSSSIASEQEERLSSLHGRDNEHDGVAAAGRSRHDAGRLATNRSSGRSNNTGRGQWMERGGGRGRGRGEDRVDGCGLYIDGGHRGGGGRGRGSFRDDVDERRNGRGDYASSSGNNERFSNRDQGRGGRFQGRGRGAQRDDERSSSVLSQEANRDDGFRYSHYGTEDFKRSRSTEDVNDSVENQAKRSRFGSAAQSFGSEGEITDFADVLMQSQPLVQNTADIDQSNQLPEQGDIHGVSAQPQKELSPVQSQREASNFAEPYHQRQEHIVTETQEQLNTPHSEQHERQRQQTPPTERYMDSEAPHEPPDEPSLASNADKQSSPQQEEQLVQSEPILERDEMMDHSRDQEFGAIRDQEGRSDRSAASQLASYASIGSSHPEVDKNRSSHFERPDPFSQDSRLSLGHNIDDSHRMEEATRNDNIREQTLSTEPVNVGGERRSSWAGSDAHVPTLQHRQDRYGPASRDFFGEGRSGDNLGKMSHYGPGDQISDDFGSRGRGGRGAFDGRGRGRGMRGRGRGDVGGRFDGTGRNFHVEGSVAYGGNNQFISSARDHNEAGHPSRHVMGRGGRVGRGMYDSGTGRGLASRAFGFDRTFPRQESGGRGPGRGDSGGYGRGRGDNRRSSFGGRVDDFSAGRGAPYGPAQRLPMYAEHGSDCRPESDFTPRFPVESHYSRQDGGPSTTCISTSYRDCDVALGRNAMDGVTVIDVDAISLPEPEVPATDPSTLPPEPGQPSGRVLALTRLLDLETQMEFAYAKHMMLLRKQKLLRAQYDVLKDLPVGIDAIKDDLAIYKAKHDEAARLYEDAEG